MRLPLSPMEKVIPVGIVSNTYTLAPHLEVARLCVETIKDFGIDINSLQCELGLSTLGEWMNFRIYFPESYDFIATDKNPMQLRLECFNSVDGSSRLVLLFGWYRFICSNGMVIGETISELSDVHNKYMDIGKIKVIVTKAMDQVNKDKKTMTQWQKLSVSEDNIANWVDSTVANKWGKKAAFRVFHICMSGHDAKYADPFEMECPSQKTAIKLNAVLGSPLKSMNLYDVSQALSWVATGRNNAEEKTQWQAEIPQLIGEYSKMSVAQ
ncbi:DUF932 domain-containing protein [Deefgea sp. CFH1-16]|nr:DUF932 domain-containing protein [Deefgea sp. CFH1-16]